MDMYNQICSVFEETRKALTRIPGFQFSAFEISNTSFSSSRGSDGMSFSVKFRFLVNPSEKEGDENA